MANRFKYWILFVLLGCFVVFPVLCGAQTAAQPAKKFKWRGACFHPKGTGAGDSFTAFCSLVKEMSGGRLEITPFLGATLVSGNESFDALKNGVVEVSALYAGYHLGKIPEAYMEVSIGSLGTHLDIHDFWYYQGGGNKYMRPIYAPHNIYFLGISSDGPVGLISKKPFKTVADIKGVKIRTAGELAAISEQLGAKTVNIPLGEVYTALQLGTVDAATYVGLKSWATVGWYEVAKYASPDFYKQHGATNISVNLKAWNSLPPDLQAIMQTACEISSYLHEAIEVAGNIEAREKMEKAGCKMIELSANDRLEIDKARTRVWDAEAKKSPKMAKIVQIHREWLLKRGYPKTW